MRKKCQEGKEGKKNDKEGKKEAAVEREREREQTGEIQVDLSDAQNACAGVHAYKRKRGAQN